MIVRSARIASGRAPDDAALRQTFVEAFPDVLPRIPRTTIQQAMLLANSQKFCRALRPRTRRRRRTASAHSPTLEDRVREAFHLALTREPDVGRDGAGRRVPQKPACGQTRARCGTVALGACGGAGIPDESLSDLHRHGCQPEYAADMKITEAKPVDGYRVFLRFNDGVSGIVDLKDLAGRGVFRAWLEEGVFEQLSISATGALEWPGDLDLCPDALYLQLTGKSAGEVFPSLHDSLTHA